MGHHLLPLKLSSECNFYSIMKKNSKKIHNSVTNKGKDLWFVAICRYLHVQIRNISGYGILGDIFVQNYITCLVTRCAPLLRG